jgi:hypothetical protein
VLQIGENESFKILWARVARQSNLAAKVPGHQHLAFAQGGIRNSPGGDYWIVGLLDNHAFNYRLAFDVKCSRKAKVRP